MPELQRFVTIIFAKVLVGALLPLGPRTIAATPSPHFVCCISPRGFGLRVPSPARTWDSAIRGITGFRRSVAVRVVGDRLRLGLGLRSVLAYFFRFAIALGVSVSAIARRTAGHLAVQMLRRILRARMLQRPITARACAVVCGHCLLPLRLTGRLAALCHRVMAVFAITNCTRNQKK
jgi:hypothetical protein